MDLGSIHVLGSLISAIAQMVAIIIVMFCSVNFFSLRPGASLRFVFYSLVYFFSSVVVFSIAAQFLMNISGQFQGLGGVSALVGASVLHLFFGLLIVALYLKHITT